MLQNSPEIEGTWYNVYVDSGAGNVGFLINSSSDDVACKEVANYCHDNYSWLQLQPTLDHGIWTEPLVVEAQEHQSRIAPSAGGTALRLMSDGRNLPEPEPREKNKPPKPNNNEPTLFTYNKHPGAKNPRTGYTYYYENPA